MLSEHNSEQNMIQIPLNFYFCRNPGLALPLIALQYHEVKINFVFGSTSDTSDPGGTSSVADGTPIKFFVDYIYLDTDERRRFAQVSHEYLIEQVQIQSMSSDVVQELTFNHPVKELIWLTDVNYEYKTALLKLNGHDRFEKQEKEYFQLRQPFDYHTTVPRINLPLSSRINHLESFHNDRILNVEKLTFQIANETNLAVSTQSDYFITTYNPTDSLTDQSVGIHSVAPLGDDVSDIDRENISFKESMEEVNAEGIFYIFNKQDFKSQFEAGKRYDIYFDDRSIDYSSPYNNGLFVPHGLEQSLNPDLNPDDGFVKNAVSEPHEVTVVDVIEGSSVTGVDSNYIFVRFNTRIENLKRLPITDDRLLATFESAEATEYNDRSQNAFLFIRTYMDQNHIASISHIATSNYFRFSLKSTTNNFDQRFLVITDIIEKTSSNNTDFINNSRCSQLNKRINVYSFALKPEEHQPSGTCNFSRIDTATLEFGASPSGFTNGNIYAVNYNVLRIMSGMGGLAYSN